MTSSVAEQQLPRVKGPPVWLDMDQKALDDAYDQSVWAPNQQHVSKRRAAWSESIRTRLKPERIAYGPSEIERVDIYKTTRDNAPIQIFIHGGAWRGGSAKDSAYPAEMFVTAGAHYIAVDFVSVDKAEGSLMPMADQVRAPWHGSIRTPRASVAIRTVSTSPVTLPALISRVSHLVTDWQKDFGLPADVVKGGVLMSGMYDLKPVRLSKRSEYVKFTDEMEQALSTQRHLDRLKTPIIVAHGTLESPEFQRQTREFAAAVKAAGKPVQLIVAEGYNHFELPETFGNPYGLLGRAALEQMQLTPGQG